MSYLIKGKYRNVTSYLRERLSPRNIIGLSSSGNIDDELWILLEYYSEVDDVGLKFLKTLGISNNLIRKRTFKTFQGFVRQAKNYYYSAKTLHPRSSGLLYYYCFLNLAKAALVIKDPTIRGKFIPHGLKYKISNNSRFAEQTVSLGSSGVFDRFYEWYFDTPITHRSFNIQTLLNYCTDIGYQCQISGIKQPKIVYGYAVSAMDEKNITNWSIVGFYELNEVLKYKKAMRPFFGVFEKIDLPEPDAREMFDISQPALSRVSFFQSINVKKWLSNDTPDYLTVRSEAIQSLRNILQINYFKSNFDFILSLPYKFNKQIRIDETIAIYLVMYYISNLVRYKPEYLENLLDTKESWLIESFIKSCPVTFLRSIISRIIRTDYVFENR